MVIFTPLADNVLLELEPEPELSQVIKVQKATEDLARFAKVLRVGPEVRDIQLGQRVLASVTAGTILPHGVLVSQRAIVGIIHD